MPKKKLRQIFPPVTDEEFPYHFYAEPQEPGKPRQLIKTCASIQDALDTHYDICDKP